MDSESQPKTLSKQELEREQDISSQKTIYKLITDYLYYYACYFGLYPRYLNFYYNYISNHLDASISQVSKHIFIGNISAAYHKDTIKDHYIKSMIIAIPGIPIINNELKTLLVDIEQEPSQNTYRFIRTNTFIEESVSNNKNILVCCIDGKSQSVMIAIAYITLKLKITDEVALNYIQTVANISATSYLEEYYKNKIHVESIAQDELEQDEPEQDESIEQDELEQDEEVIIYSSRELYNLAFNDL